MSDFKIKCKHCGHFDAPISASSFCDEHCAYCGVEFEAVEIKQAKGIFPNTWTSGSSSEHNHDPRLRAPMYSCLACDREYLKYELKIKDMLARDFDRTIIKQSVLGGLYNKIQELEVFKKEALEVIGFYGDSKNWIDVYGNTLPQNLRKQSEIKNLDISVVQKGDGYENESGGKRARAFLKKHEVKE